MGGGVFHPEERHDAGSDSLVDNGEDPADHCLGGDDGGGDRQEEERNIQVGSLPC